MDLDVDLLRELLFSLEDRQQSPRVTIVLSLAEEAADFGRSSLEIRDCLDALLGLDYIDGGGQDEAPGFWLFRKLTRKGTQFVRATSTAREWERMKRHFEVKPVASR